jgi:hypothetical protein
VGSGPESVGQAPSEAAPSVVAPRADDSKPTDGSVQRITTGERSVSDTRRVSSQGGGGGHPRLKPLRSRMLVASCRQEERSRRTFTRGPQSMGRGECRETSSRRFGEGIPASVKVIRLTHLREQVSLEAFALSGPDGAKPKGADDGTSLAPRTRSFIQSGVIMSIRSFTGKPPRSSSMQYQERAAKEDANRRGTAPGGRTPQRPDPMGPSLKVS